MTIGEVSKKFGKQFNCSHRSLFEREGLFHVRVGKRIGEK